MKSGAGLGPHKVTKAWHEFIQTVLSLNKKYSTSYHVYVNVTSSQGILIIASQSDQGMTWIHSNGFVFKQKYSTSYLVYVNVTSSQGILIIALQRHDMDSFKMNSFVFSSDSCQKKWSCQGYWRTFNENLKILTPGIYKKPRILPGGCQSAQKKNNILSLRKYLTGHGRWERVFCHVVP